jgi:hypothetical protein
MASFNFLFLLHNIGIHLWKLALERRFWATGTGYVDTHWVRGIIGETRAHTSSSLDNRRQLLLGRRKPDIMNPVNHVGKGQFPKSWVLCLNRLVFFIVLFPLYFLLTFGSDDSELMIETTHFSYFSGSRI